jgi:hypothetical protein
VKGKEKGEGKRDVGNMKKVQEETKGERQGKEGERKEMRLGK